MDHLNIRIKKVTLTNFRNIAHAEVDIPGGKMSDYVEGEPSILGLYGQNGSGKTSLLIALNALRTALSGEVFIYALFESCIRVGCDYARLEFEFSAYDEKQTEYDIFYAFSIGLTENEMRENEISTKLKEGLGNFGFFTEDANEVITRYVHPKDKNLIVFDELVQFAMLSKNSEKTNKQVLIDTSESACKASGKPFGNKTKYEQLTKNCVEGIEDVLMEYKEQSKKDSTSFVFSSEMKEKLFSEEKTIYQVILNELSYFGTRNLFVALTSDMSIISNNILRMMPLYIWTKSNKGYMTFVNLSGENPIEEETDLLPIPAIYSLGKVISKIVPGLSIYAQVKSHEENKEKHYSYEVMSIRNGCKIPLAYESDGIRRIISFAFLLVAVYNNPFVTVAIDEMDSGIFEYMFGEILSIMKESAKGQLIFTSHNLRPLEVLPHKNLLFTTVNPENRFAKLEGISGNNNMRDSYFRMIALGNGKDAFYDATDSFNIEQAMFDVGHPDTETEYKIIPAED